MKQRVIKAGACLLIGFGLAVCLAIYADFNDPTPQPDTPTKTCEPIGAQHPKTAAAECRSSEAAKP